MPLQKKGLLHHNGPMRLLVFLCAFILLAAPASAFDKRVHKLGLGIEVLDPTGVTAKYYFDRHLAVQGGFGLNAWPFGPGVHLDVLYEIPNAVNTAKEDFELPLFIGGGIKAGGIYRCSPRRRYYNDCYYDGFAGLRVPFGAALQMKRTPLEFQLELAPVFYGGWSLWWFGFGAEADLSLAARYYF